MSWDWLTYAAILSFYQVYVFSQDVSKEERSAIPCDEGWFHFREKCYRLYDDEKIWHEAADHCTSVGGHLVAIQSKEELDFLISTLLLDIKSSVWIGLHDRVDELKFSWLDGSPLNYTNWKSGEPSGKGYHGEEDCVEMIFRHWRLEMQIIGEWNDESCTSSKRPYICQKKTDPAKKSRDPQFCSPEEGGGWKLQPSCYHLVTEQQTWGEAEDYCQKNYNGHLVTVLDTTVDLYLNHVLSDLNEEIWIGIKIRDQFQQKWTSGWHVSYDTGLSKRRGDFKEGFCVLRSKRNEWTTAPCSEAHSFVCETSKAISPVLKPAVKGSHCPTAFSEWRDLDGEFCYSVDTERKVNWNTAKAECERRGGHLASIHSKEENDILHPFVKYTQADIYIGLTRSSEDRKKFQWADGSEVDYTNWDSAQPDDRGNVETCGEVFRVWKPNMTWNDADCGTEKGFICSVKKVPPDVNLQDEPSSNNSFVSPKVELSDVLIPCEEGWFHFQEKCYRLMKEEKIWSEAADLCTYDSGHLASIHSKEHLDFFVSFLLLDVKGTLWIGLNNRLDKSVYSWHDGSPLNYAHWMPGEPNGAEEDCVEMVFTVYGHEDNKIGRWNDISCDIRRPYICEKKTDPEKEAIAPQFCSPKEGGGWKYGTSCYHVVTEKKTWDEAEDYCSKNFNGHLVTVLDMTVDFFLNPMLSPSNEKVWIGIKIRDQFQQKWASGWYVSYDAGLSKRQGDFKEGLCVLRNNRKEWTMAPCSEAHSFVCESSKAIPPVLKEVAKGSHCPRNFPDWRDIGGESCYFIETEKRVKWDKARQECESRGGTLTSILSKEENEILHLFVKYTQGDIYIGLVRTSEDRKKFRWVDGSEVAYTNWDNGQPDDYGGVEACGEVWRVWEQPTMKWNDVNCDAEMGYICSIKKVNFCATKCGYKPGVECAGDMHDEAAVVCKCSKVGHSYDEVKKECRDLSKNKTIVKRSDGTIPCDAGWYYFGDKCYRVYGRNGAGKSWVEASLHCIQTGGHLVTIQNKQESDFLIAFLLLDIKRTLWIGLNNRVNKAEYVWHDGERLTWTNWNDNEPNGAEEDCVEMAFTPYGRETKKNGEWNDVACTNTRPYICQRNINPEKETPDPQFCSRDKGGGWKFGTSCYHVVEEQNTWDEAEKHCNKNFDGHLVTVLDTTVDFFLNHVVSSMNNADIWIGIKSRNQFQQKWSSGWHVGYDAGISKRHGVLEDGFCVLRFNREAWSLIGCSETNSFVCEKSTAVSPVLKPAAEGFHCPTNFHDWRDLGGENCYFIDVESHLSWYKSDFACRRRGSYLLSIHSKEENDIFHSLLKYTQDDIYFGLHRSAVNRKIFEWSDGTPLDFQKWDPSQPDDRAGVEACGEFWRIPSSTLLWNDVDCDYKKGYICSVKKVSPDTEGTDTENQLSTGAVIGIAVSVIVVLVLLGIGIYFLRKWCMRRIPVNIFSKRSTLTELTVEDDYHVYEPIEYFQRFQRTSENAERLSKLPSTCNPMPNTQPKEQEEQHTYESMV